MQMKTTTIPTLFAIITLFTVYSSAIAVPPAVPPVNPDNLMLDDYDGQRLPGTDAGPYGFGTATLETDQGGANHVMEYVDQIGDTNEWGMIYIRNLEANQDVSAYNVLEFWFYSEGNDSQRSIQIQLGFDNPTTPDSENTWNWEVPVSLSDGHQEWTKARVVLDSVYFAKASADKPGDAFDLTKLDRIGVLILNNGTNAASDEVYVDNISLATLDLLPPQPVTASGHLILEDYGGYHVPGSLRGPFGGGSANAVLGVNNRAMEFVDDDAGFGMVYFRDFDTVMDCSAYRRLDFWFYSKGNDTQRNIQVQLGFDNPQDPSSENVWNWNAPVTLSEGYQNWTKASIVLDPSNFHQIGNYVVSDEFDLTRLDRVGVLILRNGASGMGSPVYVSNIVLDGGVLMNDDFEAGTDSWETFGSTTWEESAPRSGRAHMRTVSVDGFGGISQTMTAEAGQTWKGSIWAATNATITDGTAAFLRITFLDSQGDNIPGGTHDSALILDQTTTSPLGQYRELTVYGTAPGKTELVKITGLVTGEQSSLGTVDFDDASLAVTAETPPLPSKMLNPGFESGSGKGVIAGWKTFGEGQSRQSSVSNSNSGSYHVIIEADSTFVPTTENPFTTRGYYQSLATEPGQSWKATVHAAVASPFTDGAAAWLQLLFVDEHGEQVPCGENHSSVMLDHTTKTVGAYQELTVYGTAPDNAVAVRIMPVIVQTEISSGTVRFDDATLVQTTESKPFNIELNNASFESGSDAIAAGWTAIGEKLSRELSPATGLYRIRVQGNNVAGEEPPLVENCLDEEEAASPRKGFAQEDTNNFFFANGVSNSSGYFQTIVAEVGQYWEASALVEIASPLEGYELKLIDEADLASVPETAVNNTIIFVKLSDDKLSDELPMQVLIRFISDEGMLEDVYYSLDQDNFHYKFGAAKLVNVLDSFGWDKSNMTDEEINIIVDEILSLTGVFPLTFAALELDFVDAAGNSIRGGIFRSDQLLSEDIISQATTDGVQTLSVAGYAPKGTAGVKVITLFHQIDDAEGAVYFDDITLVQGTPVAGPPLAADVKVDNFDNFLQYHTGIGKQSNDLGFITDDDGSLYDNFTFTKEFVDEETETIQLSWDTAELVPDVAVQCDIFPFSKQAVPLAQTMSITNDCEKVVYLGKFASCSEAYFMINNDEIGVYFNEYGMPVIGCDYISSSNIYLHYDNSSQVACDMWLYIDDSCNSTVDITVLAQDQEVEGKTSVIDSSFHTGATPLPRVAQTMDSTYVRCAQYPPFDFPYWFSQFVASKKPLSRLTDPFVSLENNDYLTLRYRGETGGEAFSIKLETKGGSTGSIVANIPVGDTDMHTYNYPLSDFEASGTDLEAVSTLALVFDQTQVGTIHIDSVRFTRSRQPDRIELIANNIDINDITGGVPFDVTLRALDKDGNVITNFNGAALLSVDAGTVSPQSVTFQDGLVTTQMNLDGAYQVNLTISTGSDTTIPLIVKAAPTPVEELLSSTPDLGISLTWTPTVGADEYHIYRRQDVSWPTSADYVATVSGETNNFTDTDIFMDTTYYYHVKAANTWGESGLSPIAVGTYYADDWSPIEFSADGLNWISRTEDGQLLLQTASGDQPFTAGMNLGAATAGKLPGEVAITRETYRRWFSQIAGLGFRVLRIYTLHYPRFYEELRAYNLANPQAPLYLVHGVWLTKNNIFIDSKDPRKHNLFEPIVKDTFKEDIKATVGAVHGDLEREFQLGQAYGTYTADVSPWLFTYVIGIELDALPAFDSNKINDGVTYEGTYFSAKTGAQSNEVWYAEMFDFMATELASRGRSVPLSCSNWASTDPISHPYEPIPSEDMVGLDMNDIEVHQENWPAGFFANYHLYPYYPDSINFDPGIADFEYKGRIDNYAGYLNEIKKHHDQANLPILISEFGVPGSLGNAHNGPVGRHQGNHSEQDQMRINADMLEIIKDLGLSGGYIFAWTDEWFKRTWNVQDIYLPADRRAFWRNQWCNEEMFGVLAQDAGPGPQMSVVIDGNDDEWDSNGSKTIYTGSGEITEVQALHDETYFYLRIETDTPELWQNEQIAVGFDVLPEGNLGLPVGADPAGQLPFSTAGTPGYHPEADHAVIFGPGQQAINYVATWNDHSETIIACKATGWRNCDADTRILPESGDWSQRTMLLSRPRKAVTDALGVQIFGDAGYDQTELIDSSHPQYDPDQDQWQVIFPAEYFDIGTLRFGTSDHQDPNFDLRTSWNASENMIELRLPWASLSYGDPSSQLAYRTRKLMPYALQVFSDTNFDSLPDSSTDGLFVIATFDANGRTSKVIRIIEPYMEPTDYFFDPNELVVKPLVEFLDAEASVPWDVNNLTPEQVTQVIDDAVALTDHDFELGDELDLRGTKERGVVLVPAPNIGISLVVGGQELSTTGYTWEKWNTVDSNKKLQFHERFKADIHELAEVAVGSHLAEPIDYLITNAEDDTTENNPPQGAPREWTRFGYHEPTVSFDSNPENNTTITGTKSVQVDLDWSKNTAAWGSGIRYGVDNPPLDTSSDPQINYVMKYNGIGNAWVALILVEGSGEAWRSPSHSLTTDYQTFSHALIESAFQPDVSVDGVLDTDDIAYIGFNFYRAGNTTGTPTFHIDDVSWGTPPSAPSNLTVGMIADQVTLNWDGDPQIVSYTITRNGQVIGTVSNLNGNGNTFIDNTVPPGEHVYRVFARDVTGIMGAASEETFRYVPAGHYSVTFDPGTEGTLISGQLMQVVPAGKSAVAPAIRVTPGQTFIGWDRSFHDVNQNLVVTARYTDESLAIFMEDTLPHGVAYHETGRAVSICGDTAVVASDNEKAWVFAWDGTTWFEQATLTGPMNTDFEISVSISGDTIIIGDRSDSEEASWAGAAYVFVRNGTTWTQQAKLTASDADIDDRFGFDVSIDGDTAVIGALYDDDGARTAGSAYVFVRNGTTWTEQAKLNASDPAVLDLFGSKVSVHGDTAVIGAYADDDAGSASGSAYVFVRDGQTWSQEDKLVASDAAAEHFFGLSVDIYGDTILVGARKSTKANLPGAAYIFVRSGGSWSEQAKLTPSSGHNVDLFGVSVSIHGDHAVIGASHESAYGAAHRYERSGKTWSEQDVFTGYASTGFFGWDVDISGDKIVIGEPNHDTGSGWNGKAYIYDLEEEPSISHLITNAEGDTYSRGSAGYHLEPNPIPEGEWKSWGIFSPSITFDSSPANNTSPVGSKSIRVELTALNDFGSLGWIYYQIRNSPLDITSDPRISYYMKCDGPATPRVTLNIIESDGDYWYTLLDHSLTTEYQHFTYEVNSNNFIHGGGNRGDGIFEMSSIQAIEIRFFKNGNPKGWTSTVHIDDVTWGTPPSLPRVDPVTWDRLLQPIRFEHPMRKRRK
jgi:hypothetical protein